MGFLEPVFNLLAVPLGWLLNFIYKGIPNYFLAIFLFTFLVRLLLFPLSLKTQKSQADRARLAPRLERLKKKYEKDPKKLQEKQMALYEKHGVSMTGGCMPMLVQMLVLFGIISVIYQPLNHIRNIPENVINTTINAMSYDYDAYEKDAKKGDVTKEETAEYEAAKKAGLMKRSEFTGYYKEMNMLNNLDKYEEQIKAALAEEDHKYIAEMKTFREEFRIFGLDLLARPWGEGGFASFGWLWLLPLISGLTAFLSSLLSMHYTKQATSAENQQMQGCSNVMMLVWMPAFSLFITFSVPGGVGVYWICSNLIALLQTFVLNQIYNPVKIRQQAEIEYEERRRKKAEDKKRLAEARAKEQRELAQQIKEEQKAPSKKKKAAPAKKKEEPAEEAAEVTESAETEEQPQDE